MTRLINYMLLFMFMFGVWILDVSVTTLNLGGILTNGFFYLDPSIAYHIGLGLMIFTFMMLLFTNDFRKI